LKCPALQVQADSAQVSRPTFTPTPAVQRVLTAAAVLGERASAVELCAGSGQSGTALHEAQDELEWQRWLVAELRGYSFVPGIAKHVVARNMITTGQRNRVVAGPRAATPIRLTLSPVLSPPFVERADAERFDLLLCPGATLPRGDSGSSWIELAPRRGVPARRSYDFHVQWNPVPAPDCLRRSGSIVACLRYLAGWHTDSR
jgi:hypothetical protein